MVMFSSWIALKPLLAVIYRTKETPDSIVLVPIFCPVTEQLLPMSHGIGTPRYRYVLQYAVKLFEREVSVLVSPLPSLIRRDLSSRNSKS